MSVIRTPLPGGRRLRWAAVVAGAGLILGGGVTVLLLLLALLLALDAVIPVPGRSMAGADERFLAQLRRRRAADRRRRLRDLPPERLDVLDDGEGWAAVAPRRSLGVQPIPVASIRGTVEPAKAAAFDRAWRPERAARERWERLWVAWEQGTPLPPITVFRVGADHFVRDGHHRVSVARDHHATTIDAEVVELRAPAPAGSGDARGREGIPA
jgi:hypothetical protein